MDLKKEGRSGSTCAHGRARGFSCVTLDFPLLLLPARSNLVSKCLIRIGSFHQTLIVPAGRRPTEPISLIDLALSSCTRRSPHQISSGGWLCTCAPEHLTDPSPAVCPPLLSSSHLFVITPPSPISFPQFSHDRCMPAVSGTFSIAQPFPDLPAPFQNSCHRNSVQSTLPAYITQSAVSVKTQSVSRSLRSNQSKTSGPKLHNYFTLTGFDRTDTRSRVTAFREY